jgi:hypothetical protein
MHTTIKTQKVQKKRQDVLHLALIEPLWVHEHLHIQFLWNELGLKLLTMLKKQQSQEAIVLKGNDY